MCMTILSVSKCIMDVYCPKKRVSESPRIEVTGSCELWLLGFEPRSPTRAASALNYSV